MVSLKGLFVSGDECREDQSPRRTHYSVVLSEQALLIILFPSWERGLCWSSQWWLKSTCLLGRWNWSG